MTAVERARNRPRRVTRVTYVQYATVQSDDEGDHVNTARPLPLPYDPRAKALPLTAPHQPVRPVTPITARQCQVLHAIESWLDARGLPPSVRDLRDALEISSLSAVQQHLSALERKGYIARDVGEKRGLRVLVSSVNARVLHEVPRVCPHCRRCP